MNLNGFRIAAAAFVCLTLATVALTQNRGTLENLYGNPVGDAYRTSKGLLVQATFASNGSLCAVRINAEGRKMKDAELNPVLEELAPNEARGKFVHSTVLDWTCLEINDSGEFTAAHGCGGSSWDYERATITRWGNINEYTSADVTFYRRGCKTKRPHR